MGNIFTACKNRTPLVITAGQQARSILPFDPFLYSAQATELPKPYVKWSFEPARAEDVPLAIARAYHVAMQPPRGPVLVSVPADDWARPLRAGRAAHRRQPALRPDPALLAAIGDALDACERPAFVDRRRRRPRRRLGRSGGAGRAAPARASSPRRCRRAAAFPRTIRSSPASCRRCARRIVALLAGSDLVLVLGAPAFTYHVEGSGPHVPAGAALLPVRSTIPTPRPGRRSAPRRSAASGCGLQDAAAARRRRAPRAAAAAAAGARRAPSRRRRMSVAFALQTLAELRAPEQIVVEEAPSARPVMQATCRSLRSETFYTMASGGLGFGLPAAVGVALARPRRARHRAGRRRLGDVLDPGAVERGAAAAADHLRDPEQPALCRAAGLRAGLRLRAGRCSSQGTDLPRPRLRRAGARGRA